MATNNLVIIGNGMAANRLLEELGDSHPFDNIQVLSAEQSAHYNRIMLSPLLSGETTLKAITPHDDGWYQQRKITIYLNHWVEKIDHQSHQVICSNGKSFDYQALVIATGSGSFIPNIPGVDADNVIGFRDLADVDYMLEKSPQLKHATVIGAGLLGVEAAVGLKAHGLEVSLLHRNPVLMNRQLDAKASELLEGALQQRDIKVGTGSDQIEIQTRDGHAQSLIWQQNGQTQQQDTGLIVFATGIKPSIQLAQQSGLDCERGILVDHFMQTNIDGIYSIGECCQFEQFTYGLVAPIWEQAKVLATRLVDNNSTLNYSENQHLTKLKVSGLDVHSLGEINASAEQQELLYQDDSSGVYKKLILDGNNLVGALCVGDVTDSQWYFELMRQQSDISAMRQGLLFGRAFTEEAGLA